VCFKTEHKVQGDDGSFKTGIVYHILCHLSNILANSESVYSNVFIFSDKI